MQNIIRAELLYFGLFQEQIWVEHGPSMTMISIKPADWCVPVKLKSGCVKQHECADRKWFEKSRMEWNNSHFKAEKKEAWTLLKPGRMQQQSVFLNDARLTVPRNIWSVCLRLETRWQISKSHTIYVPVWWRPDSDLAICFLLTCTYFISDLCGLRGKKKSELGHAHQCHVNPAADLGHFCTSEGGLMPTYDSRSLKSKERFNHLEIKFRQRPH